jgi:pimeloyl-ACP methyl ester carboxylesterase
MTNPSRERDVLHRYTVAGTAYAMLRQSATQPAPTLLLLAMAAGSTLTTEPYCMVGWQLHARGWNVVSLDLPCHGNDQRVDESLELAGWAARTRQGEDIVAPFQQRVNDVIEHLIQTGVTNPDCLAAAGTSRGGFMAFHAAAGNRQISAVAAFSPVTDLRALSEFNGQADNPLVQRLALTHCASVLADRAAWIMIGSADARVDTDRVIAFTRSLTNVAVLQKVAPKVVLHVVPVPGHASFSEWHVDAAEWLHTNVFLPRQEQ